MTSAFTQSVIQAKPAFDFVAAHFQCEENRYSSDNPNGFVNFGSAQNFLHTDVLGDRLAFIESHPDDTHYQAFSGTIDCRSTIADYLQSQSEAPVSPNSIVVGNGIISVLEALTVALLNEGDSLLIPSPVFPGLVAATSLRVKSEVELMETNAEDGFRLSPDAVAAHLHHLRLEGKRVRAVLICSPGNPIGQVFSMHEVACIYCNDELREQLSSVIEPFADRYDLDPQSIADQFTGSNFDELIERCRSDFRRYPLQDPALSNLEEVFFSSNRSRTVHRPRNRNRNWMHRCAAREHQPVQWRCLGDQVKTSTAVSTIRWRTTRKPPTRF